MDDYSPEEREAYTAHVASGNLLWLADALIVARRGQKEWERAAYFHLGGIVQLREALEQVKKFILFYLPQSRRESGEPITNGSQQAVEDIDAALRESQTRHL